MQRYNLPPFGEPFEREETLFGRTKFTLYPSGIPQALTFVGFPETQYKRRVAAAKIGCFLRHSPVSSGHAPDMMR